MGGGGLKPVLRDPNLALRLSITNQSTVGEKRADPSRLSAMGAPWGTPTFVCFGDDSDRLYGLVDDLLNRFQIIVEDRPEYLFSISE